MPGILKGDRILTIEYDDGESEDVATSYLRECLETWSDTIQFLDDWAAGLFTVSLTEMSLIPCTTLTYRRIHQHWLNDQKRRK